MNTPLSEPPGRVKEYLDILLNIDYDTAAKTITSFIAEHVEEAGASGAVVGLSGGVDSSTTLALAVKALGGSRVHALIMPDREATPRIDIDDAIGLAEKLGVKYTIIYINNIYSEYLASAPWSSGSGRVARGNLKARIRAALLYFYANTYNALVLGTGDRSEILIGYFTKYGDAAADILPIACLYKSQVRRLAEKLGVPKRIAYKPSSPRLWKNHMAEEELGLSYEVIDTVLYALFDKHMPPGEAAAALGVDESIVYRVVEMHVKSRHKRQPPPAPRPPWLAEPPIRELHL